MQQTDKADQLATIFAPEREVVTLSIVAGRYFITQRTVLNDSTIVVYREAIAQLIEYLGDVPIIEIGPADIERWRDWLLSERLLYVNHPTRPSTIGRLSVHTVRKHMSHARTFFRWCVDSAHFPQIRHNPAASVKMPPKPRHKPKAIADETIAALIAEIERTDYSRGFTPTESAALRARNIAIVHFLRSTGCVRASFSNLAAYLDFDILALNAKCRNRSAI
jgi:site-specific recombinase XerD